MEKFIDTRSLCINEWKNVWQNIVYFRSVLLIILKALKLDQDLNLSTVTKFNSPQNPENIHRATEGLKGF